MRTLSHFPLTNISPPIYFPFLRYPLPPLHLVCARLRHPFYISPHSSRFIRCNKQQCVRMRNETLTMAATKPSPILLSNTAHTNRTFSIIPTMYSSFSMFFSALSGAFCASAGGKSHPLFFVSAWERSHPQFRWNIRGKKMDCYSIYHWFLRCCYFASISRKKIKEKKTLLLSVYFSLSLVFVLIIVLA